MPLMNCNVDDDVGQAKAGTCVGKKKR